MAFDYENTLEDYLLAGNELKNPFDKTEENLKGAVISDVVLTVMVKMETVKEALHTPFMELYLVMLTT